MSITVDNIIDDIQLFLKDKYKIELPKEKIKGLAYSALKEAGLLTKNDRYKNYEHVGLILKMLNDNFDDCFEWEDIEHFTGNLFYAMRLATRRPIEAVNDLIKIYNDRDKLDSKQVQTDLHLLISTQKRNMFNTWQYIEKTQVKGVSILCSKITKNILNRFLKKLNLKK